MILEQYFLLTGHFRDILQSVSFFKFQKKKIQFHDILYNFSDIQYCHNII